MDIEGLNKISLILRIFTDPSWQKRLIKIRDISKNKIPTGKQD